MPLYEYECQKCAYVFERLEKMSGPRSKRCPKCGGKVEQQIAAPAIQFKGSGWYVTDYGRKTAAGDSTKPEKTEAKETTDSKEAAPAKDKKISKKEK